ncbi:MAG TPA: HAMP domain-containing sensor histidine kinase [Syntrophobacteraceae bacterium]|nr:HAMP domain-containing sensor histidine kinase [Syntrophobacteraceae bacterium]
MRLRAGILVKLFAWYLLACLVFYGTILSLFVHIKELGRISEDIVNRNYRISTASKKMIDTLWWMAENQKKYDLLKKEEYKQYFADGQKEYESNLFEILWLGVSGSAENPWEGLWRDYQEQLASGREQADAEHSDVPWLKEEMINEWVEKIQKARAVNEQGIESMVKRLNSQGRRAVEWGVVGVSTSLVIGLFGVIGFSFGMIRPLHELRRGIKSLTRSGVTAPIRIHSNDEFGELAGAFNDMAARLTEEERMRSDFISMLSHEIRTPLTSIRESVNLIAEEVMGDINEKQRRFLLIASTELERITTLLNHLLQISRLEAGAVEIHPREMDLGEFVQGAISRLVPVAEAKDISINSEITSGISQFYCDPDNLQQVLLNLLGNAIKFSPHGSEILVSVRREDSSKTPLLVFSVADRGPGIPDAEQTLVFHKYYRASGIRDQVDGVGLGLSISRHIVEAHGGEISVSSKPGEGSTFSFSLPLYRKE